MLNIGKFPVSPLLWQTMLMNKLPKLFEWNFSNSTMTISKRDISLYYYIVYYMIINAYTAAIRLCVLSCLMLNWHPVRQSNVVSVSSDWGDQSKCWGGWMSWHRACSTSSEPREWSPRVRSGKTLDANLQLTWQEIPGYFWTIEAVWGNLTSSDVTGKPEHKPQVWWPVHVQCVHLDL